MLCTMGLVLLLLLLHAVQYGSFMCILKQVDEAM